MSDRRDLAGKDQLEEALAMMDTLMEANRIDARETIRAYDEAAESSVERSINHATMDAAVTRYVESIAMRDAIVYAMHGQPVGDPLRLR